MTADVSPSSTYVGTIHSPHSLQVMQAGGILPEMRTSYDLLDAVAQAIARYDACWSAPHHATALADRFAELMHAGRVILGTPALTNIWSADRPLASCAAVPLPRQPLGDQSPLDIAEQYYLDNMGSGYNMDEFPEPVDRLLELNDHAARVQQSGACERYVGNMAHMSAAHPEVWNFVRLKVDRPLPHFNLSVNFTEDQLTKLFAGDRALAQLMNEVAYAAWQCGDPGIVSLDRFNRTNPLRRHSPYNTTAPCAEVGLAPGDTCLFGYLNLAAFARSTSPEGYDVDGLREAVALLVRALDDLHEADEQHLANALSRALANAKRRIGVSACGYADLLLWLGIEYGSPAATTLLADVLSLIQYEAVRTSLALAEERGSFPSFTVSDWATGEQPTPPATRLVSVEQWQELYRAVQVRGLRHSVLTALPPSGRSSILLGVNPSIEPFLADPCVSALSPALRHFASLQSRSVRRKATELDWQAHLRVVQTSSALVDESVSKTVNLPATATVDEVKAAYLGFLQAGLKAVSVYRPRL